MLVPIKILLDETKKPFVPYVPSNSIVIQGTDKTVEDALNERYTKTETDELVNTGDTNTLNSAKEYTDDALANFEGGITEAQVDEKINTAKTNLTAAYSAADTTTLNSAKSYTDSKFNDAGSVVVNPIVTIKDPLTLQTIVTTIRLYNYALRDLSDGKMFTVTFPESDLSYTDLELYYQAWRGSGAGWKITNVQNYSLLSGQTCIVQARIADNDYTFTVVDVLTSTESVKKNLKDVLVTTCKSPNQQYVTPTYYVYDEALRNPVHNQLFIITIPELRAADKHVRFWYRNQSSSYTGYLLTNAKSNDISNQKILMQANVDGDNTTFELVSILPTKELISNKISDLLITNCGTGGLDRVSTYYYVYSESFGVPVDKQLFTIQMPELPGDDYTVSFYNRSQSSSYTGWLLKNVKAVDVSNQRLLVQANVVEDVISFNIVGILPSKENIVDKIGNLLITDCGTGGVNNVGGFYYVYSPSFGVPVDKQLFTIQMPNLSQSENTVLFFNKSQSGSSYGGWKLNNVKASDVSNQLLLVQASVAGSTTTFNIVAGKKVDTVMDLKEDWESSPIINSTIGTVSNKCLSTNYIGDNQYKLSGFFSITNSSNTGSGNIVIDPSLLPAPIGTPTTNLFVLKFDQTSVDVPASITPMFFNWTGENFVKTDAVLQGTTAYYFIVPQVIKFE